MVQDSFSQNISHRYSLHKICFSHCEESERVAFEVIKTVRRNLGTYHSEKMAQSHVCYDDGVIKCT